ncbi:unnamed protein product [Owenia fusiformis]|uniref:Uncharacterized protein n=1 Tax=Owenia fusiformis TaxID=6347 RepID=A0A8J1XL67_OWEFU|nr:unnamed protein product [Owenia fusiformis]
MLTKFLFFLLGLCLTVSLGDANDGAPIPIKMFYKLKDVKTTQDFIKNFLKKGDTIETPGSNVLNSSLIFDTSTGKVIDSNLDFAASAVATPDGCVPKLKQVGLDKHEDPAIVMWPQCTKIEQCGGCCSHEKLECVPTTSEAVQIQVMLAKYPFPGAEYFDFHGVVMKQVHRHMQCECRCITQPAHCTAVQVYVEDECRCKCPNEDQGSRCSTIKIWNEKKCACECRSKETCDEGFFFNAEVCRCQLQPVRGRGGFDARAPNTNLPIHDPCAYIRCPVGFVAMREGPSCACRVNPCNRVRCGAGFSPVRSGNQCSCRVTQRRNPYGSYPNYRLPSGK